jgi:hypothetical protein
MQWFEKGFAVFKSAEILEDEFYPKEKETKECRKWIDGFKMAYANYPDHRKIEKCVKEFAGEKRKYLLDYL